MADIEADMILIETEVYNLRAALNFDFVPALTRYDGPGIKPRVEVYHGNQFNQGILLGVGREITEFMVQFNILAPMGDGVTVLYPIRDTIRNLFPVNRRFGSTWISQGVLVVPLMDEEMPDGLGLTVYCSHK